MLCHTLHTTHYGTLSNITFVQFFFSSNKKYQTYCKMYINLYLSFNNTPIGQEVILGGEMGYLTMYLLYYIYVLKIVISWPIIIISGIFLN